MREIVHATHGVYGAPVPPGHTPGYVANCDACQRRDQEQMAGQLHAARRDTQQERRGEWRFRALVWLAVLAGIALGVAVGLYLPTTR